MKARLKSFWLDRNEREKKVSLLAALFLLLSLLYAFVWIPGEKAVAKLSRELPVLRAKLLEMRIQAQEIEKMRKLAPVNGTKDIRQAIESSAKSVNLGLSRIETDVDGRVHAEFSSVSFDPWVVWLDRLRADSHIRLESGHIQKIDLDGRVRITAIFAAGEEF